jgi:hypothetical protein
MEFEGTVNVESIKNFVRTHPYVYLRYFVNPLETSQVFFYSDEQPFCNEQNELLTARPPSVLSYNDLTEVEKKRISKIVKIAKQAIQKAAKNIPHVDEDLEDAELISDPEEFNKINCKEFKSWIENLGQKRVFYSSSPTIKSTNSSIKITLGIQDPPQEGEDQIASEHNFELLTHRPFDEDNEEWDNFNDSDDESLCFINRICKWLFN